MLVRIPHSEKLGAEAVMSAGRFVGRVGGLAVALGIGVAVASSPGMAWADDDGSTAAGTAASGTSTISAFAPLPRERR